MKLVNRAFVRLLCGAVVTVGCQSQKTVTQPKIINSRAPYGSPQSPPLNSTQANPVAVPMAPVNPRVPGGVIVQPDAIPPQQYVPPNPPLAVPQGQIPANGGQLLPPGPINQANQPNIPNTQLGPPQSTNPQDRRRYDENEDFRRTTLTNPDRSLNRDPNFPPLR